MCIRLDIYDVDKDILFYVNRYICYIQSKNKHIKFV